MGSEADIASIDFELIVYRKGSLHAHVNLSRGYMTWRDSWQWGNNFTRTLSDEQVNRVRQQAKACLIQADWSGQDDRTEQREKLPDDPAFEPVSWQITIRWPEERQQVRGDGSVPVCWRPLKELIEQVSRICFFL
ncbi:MAG: hypothetical protein GX173_10840 [Ruminococcaceae bacterium]|jgi:hypothetical protein|nr:hypothetical protein [Oscillospiraceae bacterium]